MYKTLILENRTSAIFKTIFLLVLLALLYYSDLYSMVLDWADKKEYSHGFLIPLISLYIIWTKRDILRKTEVEPDFKGISILLLGVMLLMVGRAGFDEFTRRASIIITIMGLIYLLLGKSMFKLLLFPVGYLFFMIPLPYIIMNTIAVNLRLVDATVTYTVLSFFGIPAFQEGANLQLPNISLVVADLCTGILSLVAILALSVFYAYVTQKTFLCRLTLIILSVPLAIASNMFRLIITVGMAYYYGDRVLGDMIHQFHGIVNFFITAFLLVIAGRYIKKIDNRLLKEKLL